MAWVMMPMTLPNVVPRMRLGMTMPIGIGIVTDADVRKNCGGSNGKNVTKEEKERKKGEQWEDGQTRETRRKTRPATLFQGAKGLFWTGADAGSEEGREESELRSGPRRLCIMAKGARDGRSPIHGGKVQIPVRMQTTTLWKWKRWGDQ